jgi:PEP-CTERM motif-containing protein
MSGQVPVRVSFLLWALNGAKRSSLAFRFHPQLACIDTTMEEPMTAQPSLRALPTLRSVRARKDTRWLPVLAAVIGMLVSVSPFNVDAALLDGETVQTTEFHGTAPDTALVFGPVLRVVGPGVELANFGFEGYLSINFSDTNILITANIDQPFGPFDVLRFVDINHLIPSFASATINPATNWTGFDASRILLTADLIDLNLTALTGSQGQLISLDLTGGSVTPPPTVPEPPTYLLLGVALLGMLGVGQRKSQR